MLLRAVGLLLLLIGVLLAAVNAAYLPTAIDAHRGELPVVAFHVAVIVLGLVLAVVGLLLRRRARSDRRRRTTPEIRAALLAECDRAYRSASLSARGVRGSIIAAEHAIRAVPDEPDPHRFLENVLVGARSSTIPRTRTASRSAGSRRSAALPSGWPGCSGAA